MRIATLIPHAQLRPYVLSYRIVEDRLGEFAGAPIWTCPEPIGVLSVNFGNRSYHESGEIHPEVGLLGLQTCARRWVAQSETVFVMAMLTVPGMMTLFPNIGQDTADHLLDVANLWGQKRAYNFLRSFPRGLQENDIKGVMDSWLLDLFNEVSVSVVQHRLQLHQALMANNRIDRACEQLGITPRTLQREFQRHLGVSPKQVMNLHRLQRSIKANVTPLSQPEMLEFADQAHEIRAWRRYLDRTPHRYRTGERSTLSNVFAASGQHISVDPTVFYL